MKKDEELKKLRHPLETPLTIIAVVFTLSFYGLVSYFCFKAAIDDNYMNNLLELLGNDSELVEIIVKYSCWGVLILLVYIVIRLCYIDKSFIGKSSIRSTRLIDSKNKDLNKYVIEYCKKLNINRIPIAYIESVPIESSFLGVKVRGDEAIGIDVRTIKDANREKDYSYVKYLLARRIAHIYLNHYSLESTIFTFVGKLVPIFNNLYERAMCYSTDRTVKYLIGEEDTIKGIFSTYYDGTLYDDDVDFDKKVNDKIRTENKSESLGRFLENALSDEPLPSYRLEALVGKDKNGRLF